MHDAFDSTRADGMDSRHASTGPVSSSVEEDAG